MSPKKYAFVASGGGSKAFAFHLGVMHALEDLGYSRRLAHDDSLPRDKEISIFVGSSAGACFSIGSVFCKTLEEMSGAVGLGTGLPLLGKRALFRINPYFFERGIPIAGFFYASGIEEYVRRVATTNNFSDIVPELYVCATQLNGIRKVVFGPRDSGQRNPYVSYYNDVTISEAVAASASYPFLYQPYRIANRKSGTLIEYTDGEIRESLSVHVARDVGADVAFASTVWVPYSYDPSYGSVSRHGLRAVYNQIISLMVEQKIDKFRHDLERHEETFTAIRDFGVWNDLGKEKIDALVAQVGLTLGYRKMTSVYIAPPSDDHRFADMWPLTLSKSELAYARDIGYQSAEHAVEKWKLDDPAA